MAIRPELTVRLPNSPGALAGVCALLAAERVAITAMTLESNGQLRLIVDNHVHAAETLRERHYAVTLRDVVVTRVAGATGALAPLLRLATDAGINVDYAYGAAADTNEPGTVVLGVEDAMRAAAATGL
jgi:hypothetical protein